MLIAIAGEGLAAPLLALLRVAFGAAALGLVPGARRRVPRSAWPLIALLGLVWMAGPFFLFAWAERSIDSALAGMLNAAAPLFTAAIAATWSQTLPPRRQLRGLIVGFAGVVLICVPALGQRHSAPLGVGLVVVAVLFYGVAFNVAGPLQRVHGALPVIWRAELVACVLLLAPGLVAANRSHVAWSDLAAAAVLGVLCTAVGFALFAALAGSVGATRASLTTYFLPAVAVALGVLVRGEHITPLSFAGGGLTIVGAYLSARAGAAGGAADDRALARLASEDVRRSDVVRASR